jgi:repressor LexA
MKGLTRIQERVLEALRQRADQGDPAPTYRELCAEFNWASTGTARDHLRALVRKGYLELTGRHRELRLREERPSVARVPLVGRVVAGVPVISDENIEKRIPVPASWTRKGVFFAVRVSGDSMRDAGILEGDHVIARQRSVAANGDVVIATLDGETTIKRLRVSGKHMTLVAENPQYRSIEVRAEDAIVQGVVVGLMRSYQERGMATDRLARRRLREITPGAAST